METTYEMDNLNDAIQKINEIIKVKPELSSKLLNLRKQLETMKVSLIELGNLRDDFERGNITNENYRVQSKKLRTDIERAKNDADLLGILASVEEKEKKPILTRLKNAVISNKDFIIIVLEILKTIILP
jgi:hypothetical protein